MLNIIDIWCITDFKIFSIFARISQSKVRGRAVTNVVRPCGPTPLHTCTCKILQNCMARLVHTCNLQSERNGGRPLCSVMVICGACVRKCMCKKAVS